MDAKLPRANHSQACHGIGGVPEYRGLEETVRPTKTTRTRRTQSNQNSSSASQVSGNINGKMSPAIVGADRSVLRSEPYKGTMNLHLSRKMRAQQAASPGTIQDLQRREGLRSPYFQEESQHNPVEGKSCDIKQSSPHPTSSAWLGHQAAGFGTPSPVNKQAISRSISKKGDISSAGLASGGRDRLAACSSGKRPSSVRKSPPPNVPIELLGRLCDKSENLGRFAPGSSESVLIPQDDCSFIINNKDKLLLDLTRLSNVHMVDCTVAPSREVLFRTRRSRNGPPSLIWARLVDRGALDSLIRFLRVDASIAVNERPE